MIFQDMVNPALSFNHGYPDSEVVVSVLSM